ncbi:MAG: double zinc ribbon domain-containing protein, partial [Planctomycetota bacterium]
MKADIGAKLDSQGITRHPAKENSLGSLALGLLFPPCCCLCDDPVDSGQAFCSKCKRRLRSSQEQMDSACFRCGRPIVNREQTRGVAGLTPLVPGETCGGCKGESLHFDATVALWAYDGMVRQAIVAAKYGTKVALA